MKLLKPYILLFLCCASLLHAQKNVKKYYYSAGKQKIVNVYKYVDKNDSTTIEYWKVITSPIDNMIKTISYDKNFRIYNTFEEVLTKNGAKLTSYTDYEKLQNGENIPIKSTIQKTDVYLWKSSNSYEYAVAYTNKYGPFEFTKKRKFIEIKKIIVNHRQYKVAAFEDDYFIFAKRYNDKYSFQQRTYYAKDIGMVKYERKLPNKEQLIELELTEILTEEAFNRLLEKL